ncbi:MAG: DUF362 domain-containing protein [Bifidobacteriaceae bacterium]|jgi:uncharacterized Fe-S center protein|nr:DUF362 domain-containing protein [Bifidobacteriaceae bacterium]
MPKPKVYFTKDISPTGLAKVYEALDAQPHGKIAVKISSGEKGGHHYLQPALIKDLIQSVNGTIVECNTAYGGARGNSKEHWQVIEEHGFDQIAPVDLMDENGEIEIPVKKHRQIAYDVIGKNFANYDYVLVLSHFKGHIAGGFGGAIKNISIGIASSRGKLWIHNAGAGDSEWMKGVAQDDFLEAMAEAALAIIDYKGPQNFAYVNVLNNLSVDCDCDPNAAEPDMHDLGILSSLDPIALDQASVDLVYQAPDSRSLKTRIEEKNGLHTLEYAASELGLGSLDYELISV